MAVPCQRRIKDHLTEEAREILMNKSQEDRKRLSRAFKLLSGRFGSTQNQRQARMEFNSRYQKSKESLDLFIDALEALSVRAFPNENKETRNGEILERFVVGVRERSIHTMLITTYFSSGAIKPPALRSCGKQSRNSSLGSRSGKRIRKATTPLGAGTRITTRIRL